jgi:hypothetical protein
MARSDTTRERAKPAATGLESYRRLVELQKQMIELSQLHEQTKRERDALREEVAREVAERLRAQKSLRHRLQHKSTRLLKRLRASWNRLPPPAPIPGRIAPTSSPSN